MKTAINILLFLSLSITLFAQSDTNSFSQNPLFYKCQDLLNEHYYNKDYNKLLAKRANLSPKEKIPCFFEVEILPIILLNGDTIAFIESLKFLTATYGFDYKTHYHFLYNPSVKNIVKKKVFIDATPIIDSLLLIWKEYSSDMLEINEQIIKFQHNERETYQTHDRNDSIGFLKRINEIFDDLILICQKQNGLPNSFDNKFIFDISMSIFHILSTDNHTLIDKWNRIFPFIEKSFLEGKISNSYFFQYDRLLYMGLKKQYFGTFGSKVSIIDSQNVEERKKKYLISVDTFLLSENEKWLESVAKLR